MNLFQRLFYSKVSPPGSQALQGYSLLFGNRMSGMFGSLRYSDAVKEGYKSLVWIYRCIKKRGESVGMVPWRAYEKGTNRPLPDHPLEKLIRFPNPYSDCKDFFESLVTFLDLAGNCYVEVVYVRDIPRHLYLLRPDWMKPIPHETTFISGYEMKVDNRAPIQFDPHEVIHFKYLDPMNQYVGMSPLTAASRTIATENAIISWNKGILDNNAMPGGILKVPSQTLLPEDRASLQEEIEEGFSGYNRSRPMILWGGMDWQQLGLSQKDLDFLQQRNLNKYEICALYGTPPAVVGANEDPTYSNHETSRLSYWEDTIIPILEWIQNRFNYRLSPFFGENVELRYDLSEVPAMQHSFLKKLEMAGKLVSMHVPFNRVNERLNLGFDSLPWGDTAWVPMSLVPLGDTISSIGDDREEVPPDVDDLEEEEGEGTLSGGGDENQEGSSYLIQRGKIESRLKIQNGL